MNGILSKLAGAKCPNSMISFSTDIELNCFLAIFLSKVVVDASEKPTIILSASKSLENTISNWSCCHFIKRTPTNNLTDLQSIAWKRLNQSKKVFLMSPETFLIMSDRKLTSLSQFNRLVFDSRDFTTSLSQKFLDLLRPYKEKSPHIIGLASSSTNDNFSKMCEMLQCQKLNFNEILYPSEGIAAAEIPEINDIIVDYEKSANPKSSETRVTLVLEFLTQAILRILHFKLENTFPANGTTIQKVEKLFSIFSAKEADRQDVKSSIDEFKRINDISLEFGPYPATIFAKDLFLKLNSKYTISQSDNHDSLMKSLAIKRHLIRPSDLSSKWWSFCETIRSIQSTFDNQDSFARIVVCTQSRQSAHVIQKLVEDLSDMFDIGVCDVADENHMDEQDLGSKKCSLLVLEKDVFDSVELSLQINTVLLFDTNDFTVSFVQQLRSNPVFRNVQCAAMVQRDNEVAIKLIATLSFNYSLSKQEEFLKEAKNEQNQKTIKGTMELLIGNLGLGQIESGSNYRILPQQAIQTLEWFLSLNKEAPPVVKQEWPPMGNNEDINQVWDTLKNDIVSQEDESNPELEAILLLDPSSGVEFYISSCSWVYKGSEYRLLGAPRATLEMSRQAVGLDACLFLQSEELLDKTCRPIYVQSSAERKAAKNDYDYSHVPPMRPKAFEYFDEKQHEFHVAVIELKSDTKSPCPFRNHSIALATKYPFTSQDIPEFPVWIQDEEYKACVKSLKKPINFSSKELGAVRQFQNLLWEGLGGVSRLEKVNKEDGRFFFVVPCMEIQQTVGGSGEKDYQVDLDYLNHLDPNMHCTAYQLLSHLAVTETPIESISQEIFKATRSETKSSDLESLLSRYSKGQDTSSMIDYLNQYVSSCIIHATNHPSQKYTGLSVDEAITGNDYFASGEANCISFKDYFEQKGYKIDHPTVFGIKGICECKFPNGMVEAENEISEEVYETFLLEVSTVYPITAWLAAQFNVLPSILHHLETFSVISDLFEKLHVEPIPYSIIYPAFIHSNSDEGVDNERLEFLGDSSLKLISSLYLYQHEHYKEGQLTKYKGRIVSNFSLNIVGRHWNFDGMMKQIKFNASFFNPPFHACLARRAQPLRVISLKVCADFVEAVAGAFVLHRGVDFSWTYFERLGIVPSQSSVWAQIDKNTASDSSSIVSLCEVLESKCPNVVEKVEKAIKYRFKNPLLLVEALTHSSISSDSNYERLEFVGDAVLDFVLANYTFREYSKASPAVLSHLKYAAVNNEAFSRMSFTLGLYQYFAYEDEALKHDIDLYVEYLESFSTLPDPAFTEREGPKVLGDIFESVIGAVYIDCRGDWPTIWNVLIPMWKPYLDKFANPETLVTKDLIKLYQLDSINGKNVEFKYSQGQNDQDICHLYVEGKHVSSASANTKRLAREKAASIAYGKLSQ